MRGGEGVKGEGKGSEGGEGVKGGEKIGDAERVSLLGSQPVVTCSCHYVFNQYLGLQCSR